MQVNSISNTSHVSKNISNVTKTNNTTSASFDSYMNQDKKVSLEDIFEQAAEKYNVSVDLLKAIGKQESNFNPNAVSRSGARGVMQLMPATAKGLGVTDSFDPTQNIMGGAKLISGLIKQYGGDTKLALAAYNAGSGNVRKYGGIPPFKETQEYVVKVMNYFKQNLDASGVSVNTNRVNNNSNTSEPISSGNVTVTNAPLEAMKGFYDTDTTKSMTVEELLDKLDEIFSYDDYLKMIDIMFGTTDEDNKTSNQQPYSQPGISSQIVGMFRGI